MTISTWHMDHITERFRGFTRNNDLVVGIITCLDVAVVIATSFSTKYSKKFVGQTPNFYFQR